MRHEKFSQTPSVLDKHNKYSVHKVGFMLLQLLTWRCICFAECVLINTEHKWASIDFANVLSCFQMCLNGLAAEYKTIVLKSVVKKYKKSAELMQNWRSQSAYKVRKKVPTWFAGISAHTKSNVVLFINHAHENFISRRLTAADRLFQSCNTGSALTL